MSATPTFAEKLALIVEKAPDLRRAGVTEIEVDGFKAKLSPHVDDESLASETANDSAFKEEEDAFSKPMFAALRERAQPSKGAPR